MSVAANNISTLSAKLTPAATRAALVEEDVSLLAKDLRGVSHRVNHLLDNPQMGHDLTATAESAKEAAEHFDDAMTRLQQVVGDKSARDDLREMMREFDDSAQNIELASAHLKEFGSDSEFRSDAKQIVSEARKTVENISAFVKTPAFGADVHSTLAEARRVLKKINLVAAQLHQILDKRAPLLQMLMKRPGHVQPANVAGDAKCE